MSPGKTLMHPATHPIRVLLIEDSPDYASLVLRWLAADEDHREFTLMWTDSLSAGLTRLAQGGIDLILMDLGLPDSDGLDTFVTLRAHERELPIIVLSGTDGESMALRTIQLGAQDYLVKSTCTPEHLIRTLRHALVRHELLSSLTTLPSAKARIVGVLGSAGGAGATTVACVLAAELRHHTDLATLLIDLDSSPGLVAFTMGIEPEFSIEDAADRADSLDSSTWERLITRRPGNLDILAAPRAIREGVAAVASIREVLRYAAAHYRWIVLDLGRLNQQSAQLINCADDVILVSGETLPALHQCKQAIESLHTLGIDGKRVRLILNQKREGDLLSQKDIENMFGIRIEAILPPAHEDLWNANLKKRLPSVTGDFRLALTEVSRKMGGLPQEMPKESLLSLTALRNRFQPKKKTKDALAS